METMLSLLHKFGKLNLLCHCVPLPCHGEVVAEVTKRLAAKIAAEEVAKAKELSCHPAAV